MTNDELKNLLFTRAENLIKDGQIRQFVLEALKQAPVYIWTMPASTSGKHHTGETQTEHVLKALTVAEKLMTAIKSGLKHGYGANVSTDLLYAAVILHDLYKCGLPGQENRDIEGNVRTDPMHPLYPAVALRNIAWDDPYNGQCKIKACKCDWWSSFTLCVAAHMGPWSPMPRDIDNIMSSLGNLALMTFLSDYLSCQKGITVDIDEG